MMGKAKEAKKAHLLLMGLVTASGLAACTTVPVPVENTPSSSPSNVASDGTQPAESILKYQSKHVGASSSPTVMAQKTGTGSAEVQLPSAPDKPLKVSVTFNCFGTGSMKIQAVAAGPEFAEGNCSPEMSSMPSLYDADFQDALDQNSPNLSISTSGQVTYFVTVSTK